MRYNDEHKARARRRLLDRGGSHAKRHGFAGSGMDALAAAAGVTTGSLYKHFEDKSDFFAAVIAAELERTAHRFESLPPGDADAMRDAFAAYLSLPHVARPEAGCPLPSLTPEVARASKPVQRAFEAGLCKIQSVVAECIGGNGDRAWAIIALSVGALMMARAIPSEGVRLALLEAARREGDALLRGA
jgi:TetR/AcrR family transcriptional regulator, transcriptional repressor for nem operon